MVESALELVNRIREPCVELGQRRGEYESERGFIGHVNH